MYYLGTFFSILMFFSSLPRNPPRLTMMADDRSKRFFSLHLLIFSAIFSIQFPQNCFSFNITAFSSVVKPNIPYFFHFHSSIVDEDCVWRGEGDETMDGSFFFHYYYYYSRSKCDFLRVGIGPFFMYVYVFYTKGSISMWGGGFLIGDTVE